MSIQLLGGDGDSRSGRKRSRWDRRGHHCICALYPPPRLLRTAGDLALFAADGGTATAQVDLPLESGDIARYGTLAGYSASTMRFRKSYIDM